MAYLEARHPTGRFEYRETEGEGWTGEEEEEEVRRGDKEVGGAIVCPGSLSLSPSLWLCLSLSLSRVQGGKAFTQAWEETCHER